MRCLVGAIVAIVVLIVVLVITDRREGLGSTSVTFEDLKRMWPEDAKTCAGMRDYGVDLFDYEWLKRNSKRVLDALERKYMPPGGGWPQEKIDVYKRWLDGGMLKG